jgi:hypothetical protein
MEDKWKLQWKNNVDLLVLKPVLTYIKETKINLLPICVLLFLHLVKH